MRMLMSWSQHRKNCPRTTSRRRSEASTDLSAEAWAEWQHQVEIYDLALGRH